MVQKPLVQIRNPAPNPNTHPEPPPVFEQAILMQTLTPIPSHVLAPTLMHSPTRLGSVLSALRNELT